MGRLFGTDGVRGVAGSELTDRTGYETGAGGSIRPYQGAGTQANDHRRL